MTWDSQLRGLKPAVLMLSWTCAGHKFTALLGERCLWSFLREACTEQEQSWTFAQEHVWLSRRWSEVGIHACNWVCARLSITVHPPPSGKATPCVGTRRRLRAPSLHRQREMFFCETARVLGCHESRNPRTLWMPQLCARHSIAGQDRGRDRWWHHLGGRSPRHAELVHQEIVRCDRPISCDTRRQRQAR